MARNLPRGVEVAGLLRRVVAWLIDGLVPAAVSTGLWLLVPTLEPGEQLVVAILGGLVVLGWAVLLWWGYATRGAGIGYRVMGLQLVGLTTGRPIGWGRYLVRQLVFGAIAGTGVGWIALLIFLVIHERRQGWHDLAGQAIAIQAQTHTTGRAAPATRAQRAPSTTVALPPHLIAAAFDGSGAASFPPAAPSSPSVPAHSPAFGGRGVQEETGWRPPARPGDPGGSTAAGGWRPQDQASAQAMPAQSGPAPSGPAQAQWGQAHIPPAHSQAAHSQAAQSQPAPQAQPDLQPRRADDAVVVRRREALPEDDDYGTRLAPNRGQAASRPGHEGWFLLLDDGRRVPVTGTVLVGRRPSLPADGSPATLVEVGEGGHAVSKVHLAVGVDQRGLSVTDRGSTNGTAVVASTGTLQPCQPGVQVRVREGQTVSFGDRSFVVMRHREQ